MQVNSSSVVVEAVTMSDIRPTAKSYTIKNSSGRKIILVVGLYDVTDGSCTKLGHTILPNGKSYQYTNRFITQLFQVSIGYLSEDIGNNDIDVVCYEIPVFDEVIVIDDTFKPTKTMDRCDFTGINDSDDSDDDDDNEDNCVATNNEEKEGNAVSSKLICQPVSHQISNKSTNDMLINVGIVDILTKEENLIGWTYLPINKTYNYVNEFTAKTLQIKAGIPSKKNPSQCINVFCIDLPVCAELTEFDDSYEPFQKMSHNEFTTSVN